MNRPRLNAPAQHDNVFDEFVRQCSPHQPPPPRVPEVEFHPPPLPEPAKAKVAAQAPDERKSRPKRQSEGLDPFEPFKGSGLRPLIVTLSQAAALLTLSTRTVQGLVREGRIPKPRLLSRGRVGWLLTDIERYVASLPESDLLCPPNTSWRLIRDRPVGALKEQSPATAPKVEVAEQPVQRRWQDARRDREGQLPAAGAVYQIPGTDIVCVRRHRFGALPMPFAIVIHEQRYTWAEMELTGARRELALVRLRSLNQACSVMAADVIEKEEQV